MCAIGYSWYVRANTRDWHGPRICGIQTGISFVGIWRYSTARINYIIFYFFINIVIINIDSCTHAALSESLMIFIFSSTLRSRVSTPAQVWVTVVSLNWICGWYFTLTLSHTMLIRCTMYYFITILMGSMIYCSGRPLGSRHTKFHARPLFLSNTEIHHCLFCIVYTNETGILRRLIVFQRFIWAVHTRISYIKIILLYCILYRYLKYFKLTLSYRRTPLSARVIINHSYHHASFK